MPFILIHQIKTPVAGRIIKTGRSWKMLSTNKQIEVDGSSLNFWYFIVYAGYKWRNNWLIANLTVPGSVLTHVRLTCFWRSRHFRCELCKTNSNYFQISRSFSIKILLVFFNRIFWIWLLTWSQKKCSNFNKETIKSPDYFRFG